MPSLPDESAASGHVTLLLDRVRQGDNNAREELYPLVYDELRQIANRLLGREAPGHTLQPTALVHEAYLKLFARSAPESVNRAHFLAIAARAMRQVLVDNARRRRTAHKAEPFLTVPDGEPAVSPDELIALDDALTKLGAQDERLRQVVELRFFAGCTEEEIAQALDVTTRTVQRDWAKARAWLHASMTAGNAAEHGREGT
jgi:RNA polymerase sigma factor (TIGR02999 family)